jgi:hypothetical protein
LDAVFDLFEPILSTLQAISEAGFSGDTSSIADGLQTKMLTSNFLVTFVTVRSLLHYTLSLTIKLQKRGIDYYTSYSQVSNVITVLKNARENSTEFNALFESAQTIADKHGIVIKRPRQANRQTLRNNPPAHTTVDHYLYALYYPFLDHMILDLSMRFVDGNSNVELWKSLLPGHLKPTAIEQLANKYYEDLPLPMSLHADIKLYCELVSKFTIDSISLSDVLKNIDEALVPNVSTLIRILLTLPVTTCECERSVSNLRRLKTHLRATMGSDRLSGLALLSVHYDLPIEEEEVIDMFAKRHRRKIELCDVMNTDN